MRKVSKNDMEIIIVCIIAFTSSCLKVLDHCHFTGQVRGIAHNQCNLSYTYKNKSVKCILHNASKHDFFIMQALADRLQEESEETVVDVQKLKKRKRKKPNVMAQTDEEYLTIKVGKIQFLDSYQFLAGSLDSLASSLGTHKGRESILDQVFPRLSAEQQASLRRKGIFPYEYLNSFEKLEEPFLPQIEAFYSSLKGCTISKEEYAKARDVFQLLVGLWVIMLACM